MTLYKHSEFVIPINQKKEDSVNTIYENMNRQFTPINLPEKEYSLNTTLYKHSELTMHSS